MRSSVAAATVASKVISMVVGEVWTALVATAPATSVVYAGVPLRPTTWSNVTVSTVVAALADSTLIGVVGCGLFTKLLLRRRARRADLKSEPAMGISLGKGSGFG